MIGLNKIGLNQVQLNQLYLNTLCACQKSSGGDGFPRLPGDVTRWSFKGLTNEMMSKNPRLEDADHKGRFLTFKNFAWSGMSGVNGYKFDFLANEWVINNDQVSEKYSYKIVINNKQNSVQLYNRINLGHIKITLKITGIEINKSTFRVYDNVGTEYKQDYTKDGIYEIDYTANEGDNIIYFYVFGGNMGQLENPITIEQLPLYPDALVFDGVDDYGICENLPILTKEKGYTVVALRHLLGNGGAMLSKRTINPESGAFVVDKDNNTVEYSYSFGTATKVSINRNNPFVYQTSNSYMGQAISTGYTEDNSYIIVGAGLIDNSNSRITEYTKCSIHELVILDHDATEEELTKIKNYFIKTYPWLFFDQAWTVTGKTNEDEDRATIANITGNGNNLVLSNFGFAGNSGYGEYAYNWNTWKINKVDSTKSNVYHNRMEITLPAIGESSRTQCDFYSPLCKVGTIYDFSFKISGLTGNSVILVRPGTFGGGASIAQYNKDGVYHLNYTLTDESIVDGSTQNRIYFFVQNFSNEEMNLTVEQIPEYEGYLVTDGVDDKIASSAFKMGKDFTVVGDWKFIDNKKSGTGLVKVSSFYIYNTMIGLDLYINSGSVKNSLDGIKSINAACSDGRAYDRNWNEILANTGKVVGSGGTLEVSSSAGRFVRIAFKNLAIYPRILSKDDCIKAYNYLQTLKAK